MVNNPLIRPYFLGEVAFGVVLLGSYDILGGDFNPFQ